MIGVSIDVRKLWVVASTALVLGVAGCSSSVPDADGVASVSPASEPSDSASASATASESPQTSGPTATTSPSETETAAATTPSDESSDSVLDPDVKGRALGLDDFFRPERRWTEQLYDIANERDVTGVGTTIASCWNETYPLEMRLGNDFSTFSFRAGQSNLSASSAETVVVQVEGNGDTLDIKRIPFNTVESVFVEVNGVNALKINVSLDEELSECDGADIVLFDIKAE